MCFDFDFVVVVARAPACCNPGSCVRGVRRGFNLIATRPSSAMIKYPGLRSHAPFSLHNAFFLSSSSSFSFSQKMRRKIRDFRKFPASQHFAVKNQEKKNINLKKMKREREREREETWRSDDGHCARRRVRKKKKKKKKKVSRRDESSRRKRKREKEKSPPPFFPFSSSPCFKNLSSFSSVRVARYIFLSSSSRPID